MIRDFITQVKTRGLARTNKYEVVIMFPNRMPTDIKRIANLFCDGVTLPGANIATTAQRAFGEIREMPYEKMYDPVTMSFYVDSGMQIKRAFEEWQHMIIDPDTRTIGYYNNYTTDIDIYIDNVDGSTPYVITLYEAYPKAISSVYLDNASRDVMKMTVAMQYKYWKSDTYDQVGARGSRPFISAGAASTIANQSTPKYPSPTFDPPKSIFTTIESTVKSVEDGIKSVLSWFS